MKIVVSHHRWSGKYSISIMSDAPNVIPSLLFFREINKREYDDTIRIASSAKINEEHAYIICIIEDSEKNLCHAIKSKYSKQGI